MRTMHQIAEAGSPLDVDADSDALFAGYGDVIDEGTGEDSPLALCTRFRLATSRSKASSMVFRSSATRASSNSYCRSVARGIGSFDGVDR